MTGIQSWTVGSVQVTSIVEAETPGVPPEFFFPAGSAADVAAQSWLVPTFASPDGSLIFRVQAFVLDLGHRRLVVDPCVGNEKERSLPLWHMQNYTFLNDFVAAGFDLDSVNDVVHTHLHADHVGWIPVSSKARGLRRSALPVICTHNVSSIIGERRTRTRQRTCT
jgi:glyoxylase-like metal-dependent hydrolase (beta-lactamase superfamily II)